MMASAGRLRAGALDAWCPSDLRLDQCLDALGALFDVIDVDVGLVVEDEYCVP